MAHSAFVSELSEDSHDLCHEAAVLRPKWYPRYVRAEIISHYENNYSSVVNRLNPIEEKVAEIDYATAPGFRHIYNY